MIIFLPIGLIAILVFFFINPKHSDKAKVLKFNIIYFAITSLLTFAWYPVTLASAQNDPFAAVGGLLFASFTFVTLLLVGVIVKYRRYSNHI